jgi:hypothetical protein
MRISVRVSVTIIIPLFIYDALLRLILWEREKSGGLDFEP